MPAGTAAVPVAPAPTIPRKQTAPALQPEKHAEPHVDPEGRNRSVLQRTDKNCRLLTLPAATLYDIARRAGPRARRLCRALCDAYGHLDCGLRPSSAACPDAALALLAHHRPALRHVTTLTLPPMPQDGAHPFEDLLPAICTSLPALQSLALPLDRPLTDHHLSQLHPLAASLTALHAQLLSACSPGRTPLHPLPRFTHLAALTLATPAPPPGPETQAWLNSLAALPRLLHLSLFHLPNTCPAVPEPPFTRLATATPHAFDASWLPGLATATPRLTSLSLGALPVAWTPHADTALTHGFPNLRCLSFMHAFEPLATAPVSHPAAPHPAAPNPVAAHPDTLASAATAAPPAPIATIGPIGPLAALAQRTASLLATELHVVGSAGGAQPAGNWGLVADEAGVPQLAQLTAVLQGLSGRQAAWVWEALAQQTELTSLRLSCSGTQLPGSFLRFPALPRLGATLVELQLGWHWDPGPLVACLTSLTRLRTLGLHRNEFMASRWPPEAVSQLALLTHLESLTITEQMLPSKLLHSIAHLTRLRELTLTESADCYPRLLTVGDADLGHLRPLRRCLTSLELAGIGGVRGWGLTTLRGLEQLQRLRLRALRMVPRHEVHRFLLPLPPALSVLQVLDAGVSTASRNSLVAAAHRQECRAFFSPRPC